MSVNQHAPSLSGVEGSLSTLSSQLSGVGSTLQSSLVSGVTAISTQITNIKTVVSGSDVNVTNLVNNILGSSSALLGVPSIGVGYRSGGRYVTNAAAETQIFSASQPGFLFVQGHATALSGAQGLIKIYDGAQDAAHLIMTGSIDANQSQLVSAFPYQARTFPIVTAQADGVNNLEISIGFYTNSIGGVVEYQTGLDSYLSKLSPDTNYVSASSGYLGRGAIANDLSRILLQFDLSTIPSTAMIGEAVLRLRCAGANTATITLAIHRILRNLTYAQATWNVYSTGNAWPTAGMESGTDYYALEEFQQDLNFVAESYYDFDVTEMVQQWVSGVVPNYGMLLRARDDVGATKCSFYLLNHATVDHKPSLRIRLI